MFNCSLSFHFNVCVFFCLYLSTYHFSARCTKDLRFLDSNTDCGRTRPLLRLSRGGIDLLLLFSVVAHHFSYDKVFISTSYFRNPFCELTIR